MPHIEKIYKKYKDLGLNVVAIDARESGSYARKFIKENNLTLTFLDTRVEGDDPVKNIFKIKSVPTNFILNEEGRIFYLHLGYKAGDEKLMEEHVRDVLGL